MVQTPRLCLQDLLPTSTYQSYLFLFAYLQASCRSSHLSKHLTCVSRTYSQPQPVEIFSMLISRQVVGAFTCPNTSLVSPGPTPNLSLSRYSQSFQKHVVSGNQLTSHLQQMTSQPTCHKKWNKNTSPRSRILKFFDALDFTSAMYQPSDHFRTLVQAQHRSRENLGAQYKRSQPHLRWCP